MMNRRGTPHFSSSPSTSCDDLSASGRQPYHHEKLSVVVKRPLESSDSSASTGSSALLEKEPLLYRVADRFAVDRDLARCALCEFFCSAFLMYGGSSVEAVFLIQQSDFTYMEPMGWGMWLIFALYMGFNISGAHLNPAISFMHFTLGNISGRRALAYSMAQFLGFFTGSAFTFLIYYEGINSIDGGVRQVYGPKATAGIFATYPKDYLSITGGVIDQIMTTCILCTKALCITDRKNRIPRQIQPFLLGLSLWTIVAMWSQNCGAALNPARDLAPRFFTFVAGWGWEVFSFRNYQWFLVPVVAPMCGGALAGHFYKYFIGDYLSDAKEKIIADGALGASLMPLFDGSSPRLIRSGIAQPPAPPSTTTSPTPLPIPRFRNYVGGGTGSVVAPQPSYSMVVGIGVALDVGSTVNGGKSVPTVFATDQRRY